MKAPILIMRSRTEGKLDPFASTFPMSARAAIDAFLVDHSADTLLDGAASTTSTGPVSADPNLLMLPALAADTTV